MSDDPFAWLAERRAQEWRRDLGDGRSIWLRAQIFNYVLVIGPTEAPWYDDDW